LRRIAILKLSISIWDNKIISLI